MRIHQQAYGTYNYNYDVKDAYSSVHYGKQETSDGKGSVSGNYHVLLPDGRKQMVTYKADEYGYVADIKYEGEAQTHPYNIDTPYYVNKEHKKYETPHNNYPVNTYTSTSKYPDSLYSTTTPKYHKNYQQTHHVQANNNYDQSHHVSYPDTYFTPYNTGYDTHQTSHYPKGNKHYGNLYKDQDNYQSPYVKEHAVTSTKYHTNKPNPHTKYPQTYSTSYPYGKSETKERTAALTYPPEKYPR